MTTWRSFAGEPDPRRVGEVLDRVTRAIGAPPADTLGTIFSRWKDIVGNEIADHATPKSLRDGVLHVEVDQPAWAAQLGFLAAQILAKLQAEAGPDEVGEIRFRVTGPAAPGRPRKGR